MADAVDRRVLIGAGFQRVRRTLGVAQGWLARTLCVTPGAVSQWESGTARFPLERLPEIADALGVDGDLLLYEMGFTDRLPAPTLEELAALRIRRERNALWAAHNPTPEPPNGHATTAGNTPAAGRETRPNAPVPFRGNATSDRGSGRFPPSARPARVA